MIFGILCPQYLSSQKPKSEALRLLGSTRIPYGIGADPIEASREGVSPMTDHYRIIRKEINLTPEELELIQGLMKQEHADQFSPFVRQKLMDLVEGRQSVTDWFTLWQSQKIEQISRDILQVTIMAEQTQQVTAEHLRIILACVQELMAEVEKAIPLSPDFRDKYMGG